MKQKECNPRMMLENMLKLLSNAESDYLDYQTYKIIDDWDVELGPDIHDPSSGSFTFKKTIESGSTCLDLEVDINDEKVKVDECAEMFKVDIYQVVHFYVGDEGYVKIGLNQTETNIIQTQIGYEDISYEGNAKLEDVEKALLDLPVNDDLDASMMMRSIATEYYEDV